MQGQDQEGFKRIAVARQIWGYLAEEKPTFKQVEVEFFVDSANKLSDITAQDHPESHFYPIAQAILSNSIAASLYKNELSRRAEAEAEEAENRGAEKQGSNLPKQKQNDGLLAGYYEDQIKLSGGTGPWLVIGGLLLTAAASYYQYLKNQQIPDLDSITNEAIDSLTNYWVGSSVLMVAGALLITLAIHLYHKQQEIEAKVATTTLDPSQDYSQLRADVKRRHWAVGLSLVGFILSAFCYPPNAENLLSADPNYLHPKLMVAHFFAAVCVIATSIYLYYALVKAQPETEILLEKDDAEKHETELRESLCQV